MRGQTVDDFLTDLAARMPAPGGGATAALHAAQAAALVGMVARYSDGARFAAHAEEIAGIVTSTDRLRVEALRLAEADAAAFTAIRAAPRQRLSVSGGTGGDGRVVDARPGEVLKSYKFTNDTNTIVNES